MAATPATGTRGQIPGIGARGQRKRRNPVNLPTWRGSKLTFSNDTPIGLAGSGSTDSTATGTLSLATPLAGAGSSDSVGAGSIAAGLLLAANGYTDSSATATLSVSTPSPTVALLPRTQIPGIATGQPRRRNPINAPRTFRGTRVFTTPPIVTSVGLAGVGTTDTNATAMLFVAALSLQAVGTTDSLGKATLTLSALVGQGLSGSVGRGTLGELIPVVGTGTSASAGVATLSVGVTEALQGFGSTTDQGIATLSAVIPLAGAATGGSVGIATLAVSNLVSLTTEGDTGSIGRATLVTTASLAGLAVSGTSATASLGVSIPLASVASGSDRAIATLALAIPLTGAGSTTTLGRAQLVPGGQEALVGVGLTGSMAVSSLLLINSTLLRITLVDDAPTLITLVEG